MRALRGGLLSAAGGAAALAGSALVAVMFLPSFGAADACAAVSKVWPQAGVAAQSGSVRPLALLLHLC